MKKLLALVLALVMSMSLVTISNAAFKDADKISNKEAVDVMAAVGVLAGYDNGEFGATDTLTRAQACKIIAYLDLGKDVAEALPAVQVFSDLPASNWAAKYVAYCADAGYVSGVGDNKFAPDEKVTGYQFGKEPELFDTADAVTVSTGINVPPCGWYYNELSHFLDCARRHEPSPYVTREQLLTVVSLLEKILENENG